MDHRYVIKYFVTCDSQKWADEELGLPLDSLPWCSLIRALWTLQSLSRASIELDSIDYSVRTTRRNFYYLKSAYAIESRRRAIQLVACYLVLPLPRRSKPSTIFTIRSKIRSEVRRCILAL